MFLLPLRHENMQGRRWPVVTFALIALNIIAFLGTHWTIEAQQALIPERVEVRKHLVYLAAMHPELKMGDDAHKFIAPIADKYPDDWKELGSPDRKPEDAWDARIRQVDDPAELQAEMDSLSERFQDFERNTFLARYGFVPAHPAAISYLTCNFLHAGWLHLVGNMWFLWLAGFILEDNWGRAIYLIFYLLAGAVAAQIHAWFNPGSLVPMLGASGAIAALMGAFLVRFPKLKIEMFFWIFVVRGRFKAPGHLAPASLGSDGSILWFHVSPAFRRRSLGARWRIRLRHDGRAHSFSLWT
jgi:membrane associated rhomboid family serine protease